MAKAIVDIDAMTGTMMDDIGKCVFLIDFVLSLLNHNMQLFSQGHSQCHDVRRHRQHFIETTPTLFVYHCIASHCLASGHRRMLTTCYTDR